MDNLIPELYREYGLYINKSRAFPLDIDGLKPVERRILLVSHQVARTKFAKTAQIDGTTIAKYHPHSSVYSTIVNLANQGFLDKQGNFGNKLGVEPSPAAAMRYTEIKLNSVVENLIFQNLSYVPKEITEGVEEEPLFLSAMLPACLLGIDYTQGIGFGMRCVIPSYKMKDLIMRLKWLLGIEKKEPVIKPMSDCRLLSNKNDLKNLLTTGVQAIKYQGTYVEYPTSRKFIVKSWPMGKKFETILTKLKALLDVSDIGYTDLSNEEKGTYIQFEVIKRRNMNDIYQKMSKCLKEVLKGSISFQVNLTNLDGIVRTYSIDELLLLSYENYKKYTRNNFEDQITQIIQTTDEIDTITKIRPFLNKALTMSIKDAIVFMADKVKVNTGYLEKLLQKHSIHKLITAGTDIHKLEEKKILFQSYLEDIDEYCMREYGSIC